MYTMTMPDETLANLSALTARRDALVARLDKGADLIAQAEARGDMAQADRLADHYRKLLAEYEAVDSELQALYQRGNTKGRIKGQQKAAKSALPGLGPASLQAIGHDGR